MVFLFFICLLHIHFKLIFISIFNKQSNLKHFFLFYFFSFTIFPLSTYLIIQPFSFFLFIFIFNIAITYN